MIEDGDRDRDAPTRTAGEPASGVASPCNSVCRMDADGVYCIGCFRTLEEIAGWSSFDDARRLLVWEELRRRRLRAGEAAQDGSRAAC